MDRGQTRRVLYIGNRSGVLRETARFPELKVTRVFALRQSYLDRDLDGSDVARTLFRLDEKERVIGQICRSEFDLLISGGCPLVLPVSAMRKPHQLFLNVHPSYLPHLRGPHPINGALFNNAPFTGATMHFMDDGVDTGTIIHQEKIDLTDDLDLGLLYRLLFDLEVRVFSVGMRKLVDSGFRCQGRPQGGGGSFCRRSQADMQVHFASMSDEEIVKRTRAFGIESQGVSCEVEGRGLRVFDAEHVFNPYLLAKYAGHPRGTLLLEYEDKLLVKSRDGVIKVKRYQWT